MPRPRLARLGRDLRLGVAADGLALVEPRRLFGGAPRVVSEQPLDLSAPDALAPGLRALFAGAPVKGRLLRVVLADELVRLWPVTPPPRATRMGDLEAAAALRFQHLFGASCLEWKISADWDAVDPFLAAAAPLALLDALAVAAREHGVHLVAISPHFVAAMNAWRRARRAGAWFGLVHGGVLTLAAYQGRQLAALRSSPIPADADHGWLASHVAREALRIGIARPDHLQLSGAAPAAWACSPEEGKFACSLLEQADDWSDLARLARTGAPA